MSRPPMTVITPSFNQARYIRRTIESVLSQGVSGLQYLVFDARSTDGAAGIIREYAGRLTATIERDAGQADAVNKGLARADGEIIGWLNSDDTYCPGACARVIEAFREHPGVDVIYGEADHIDEDDGVIEAYYTEPFSYERLKDVCFLCQPAVFFRRTVVDRYGPLQSALQYCMDYEYWLRILAEQPPYFLRAKLAGSRLHPQTKTLGSTEIVHREILEMLRQKFGVPPAKWVHNLAHVIVREQGYTRATPAAERAFIAALIGVTEQAFQQYAGGVPPGERHTLDAWRHFVKEAAWK